MTKTKQLLIAAAAFFMLQCANHKTDVEAKAEPQATQKDTIIQEIAEPDSTEFVTERDTTLQETTEDNVEQEKTAKPAGSKDPRVKRILDEKLISRRKDTTK